MSKYEPNKYLRIGTNEPKKQSTGMTREFPYSNQKSKQITNTCECECNQVATDGQFPVYEAIVTYNNCVGLGNEIIEASCKSGRCNCKCVDEQTNVSPERDIGSRDQCPPCCHGTGEWGYTCIQGNAGGYWEDCAGGASAGNPSQGIFDCGGQYGSIGGWNEVSLNCICSLTNLECVQRGCYGHDNSGTYGGSNWIAPPVEGEDGPRQPDEFGWMKRTGGRIRRRRR